MGLDLSSVIPAKAEIHPSPLTNLSPSTYSPRTSYIQPRTLSAQQAVGTPHSLFVGIDSNLSIPLSMYL